MLLPSPYLESRCVSRFSVVMIYETGKCGLQALLVTFTFLKVPLAQHLYSCRHHMNKTAQPKEATEPLLFLHMDLSSTKASKIWFSQHQRLAVWASILICFGWYPPSIAIAASPYHRSMIVLRYSDLQVLILNRPFFLKEYRPGRVKSLKKANKEPAMLGAWFPWCLLKTIFFCCRCRTYSWNTLLWT